MPKHARNARLRLALLLGAVTAAACSNSNYAHLYATQPFAPSYTSDDVANLNHMGANLVDKGVNFAVYSEHATEIQLALFDDPESDQPTRSIAMTQVGNVWSVYVEGVGPGQAYGYVAWGPNWTHDSNWYCGSIFGFHADVDGDGNRFNPNKLLWDPYAREITRKHDWSRASTASGPDRAKCDYGAASKGLVVQSTYQWSANEDGWRKMRQSDSTEGHRWQDQVIYEVHPKGFTADSASGVAHPGTYRGIGENAAYLKNLGITTIELMPVFEKPVDGGYWGYQTLGFFIPERTYANDQLRWDPIEEFKWMVDQLHQNGIEVMLDVVYNHTGEGGLWRQYIQDSFTPDPSLNPANYYDLDPKEIAGLYSFRGLDNQAYYALDATHQYYWNNTGVGQETRPNHAPMRRLILDSLEYWVTEFHVDGFRFDLAPILDETDLNYNLQADMTTSVTQDIVDDPVLQQYNTRLVAEPWSLAAFDVGKFPAASNKDGTAWGEWNGPFRDWWRSFWNGDQNSGIGTSGWALNAQDNGGDCGFFLYGSKDYYAWNNRRPYNSINFVTIHDGFTMYDLFSYDQKVNGCGPLNPACCPQTPGICDESSGEDHNRSFNWGKLSWSGTGTPGTTQTPYADGQPACETTVGQDGNWGCTISSPAAESIKRHMMRDMFTAMMISHGTPMILGGDEWMRTQLGNNNAYSTGADNPTNWFAWGDWIVDPQHQRMHDFVRQVIEMRNTHRYAFAPDQYDQGMSFKWMNEGGTEGPNWSSRHLAQYYDDASYGKPLYIIINGEDSSVDFQLPAEHSWNRLIDTQPYFDLDDYYPANGVDPTTSANGSVDAPVPVPTSDYNTPPRTIVVLEAAD